MVDTSRVFSLAEESFKQASSAKVRVSFQYIDWTTDTFFVHGLNDNYYHKLFSTLHVIKCASVEDIKKLKHPSLEVKSIRWRSAFYITQDSFPEQTLSDIERSLLPQAREKIDSKTQASDLVKDAFEISIAKNSGRIHGFLFSDTFYLVWFDPAHNLFPGMKRKEKGRRAEKNPVRKFEEVRQVRCCSTEGVNNLREENDELRKQVEALEGYLEQETSPSQ